MNSAVIEESRSISDSNVNSFRDSSDELVSKTARIRTVRLVRPSLRHLSITSGCSPSYGFTVRGGYEYGTPLFVSNVSRNSEAEYKGLLIGDQILSVNGYRLDSIMHKEFVQFIMKQERLILKVRNMKLLPFKDKDTGAFQWNSTGTFGLKDASMENRLQLHSKQDNSKILERDVSVILNVEPHSKLGLGICKGPEWKSGIFVQFTKNNSVAREAGLRPGDQILSVNNIDFSEILFSQAVSVMKSSNKLHMLVRIGAACDLFPGESSGYNSSASSVTGDQSPCWADIKSKRLTCVNEESASIVNLPSLVESMESIQFNFASNCRRGYSLEYPIANAEPVNKFNNRTIIKLSENETSINNTLVAKNYNHQDNYCTLDADAIPNELVRCLENKQTTKSSIQLKASSSPSLQSLPPPPPPPPSTVPNPINQSKIAKASYLYSVVDKSQHESNETKGLLMVENGNNLNFEKNSPTISNKALLPVTTLSNAILDELKKRNIKKSSDTLQNSNKCVNESNESHSTTISCKSAHHSKNDQHNALMTEFKQVHKKIFKNISNENSSACENMAKIEK